MSSFPFTTGSRYPLITRRQMLERTGMGLGSIALTHLLHLDGALAREEGGSRGFDLRPKKSHFEPKVKSVILMMQNGGPSQMDLFDPKPILQKYSGKNHQEALKDSTKVEMFQGGSQANTLMGSPFKFDHYGESGIEFSNVIPNIGSLADEMCMIRSMHTGHNNHTEALIMFTSGKIFQGRPTFGAWISYALGTENQNLPAYIVLRDPAGYNTSGRLTWTSGWLPALYEGTEFSAQGSAVLNLHPTSPRPEGFLRGDLDFLEKLNRLDQRRDPRESDLETRIQNYELAAGMMPATDQILDMSKETPATQNLYGLDNSKTKAYGLRCLMARKLIEAGVRFVQIHPDGMGQPWDHHGKLKGSMISVCGAQDLPTAGLIQDLKQRGLLESTLVIWSGEFGRLPITQGGTGRDHNRNAFTLWMIGGNFKRGYVHGATDDVAYAAVENRVGVSDLHATILDQLGLDHDKVSYRHSGRDETLTDSPVTEARVLDELLA